MTHQEEIAQIIGLIGRVQEHATEQAKAYNDQAKTMVAIGSDVNNLGKMVEMYGDRARRMEDRIDENADEIKKVQVARAGCTWKKDSIEIKKKIAIVEKEIKNASGGALGALGGAAFKKAAWKYVPIIIVTIATVAALGGALAYRMIDSGVISVREDANSSSLDD